MIPYKRHILPAVTLAMTALPAFAGRQERVDLQTLENPVYTVEGNAFVRHNGDRFCNRPLYCNHIYAVAFGGDKPFCMLGNGNVMLGGQMFALVRQGKGIWLQHASDITSEYRPGRMEWIVKDATWGATAIHLDEVPASQGPGLVTRVRAENALPGDTLVWASGAAVVGAKRVLWTYDMTSQKSPLINRDFVPADCAHNSVKVKGSSWIIHPGAEKSSPACVGRCGIPAKIVVADANAWSNPVALLASTGQALPIACGMVPLVSNQDFYWSLLGPDAGNHQSPAGEFAEGMKREESLEKRVVVDTPDPWLDAAVGASSIVVDGCYRDHIYTHSGMRWSTALLGWRTIFGGTVFGWPDNVKAQAKLCIGRQIKESGNRAPMANPKTLLSSQAPESRLFGKGRVDIDHPHHYDMQSQFFDQIQHAWRWTGDVELEKTLRPSLDLHCEYIQDCFDPARLGIYESYANTWPTDDQWYNGGGTSEETAYAYRAECTALQLARRAGDANGMRLHAAAIARIRKGFFELLWSREHGHPGAYREQAGLKRLHESAWLYSIFCPIDAGLLDVEQAAQALHYTEWALERIKPPYGGEQCWPSNWVPSIWSVREMWAGDNFQLALAYFQSHLSDDGWKVLRGTFPQQLLFGNVPGDLGHPAGGTDFNDCNSMFARAVVEGLFGYTPDYPDGIVKISPQFPSAWDHASIHTPDMSIAFRRRGAGTDYKITLAKACAIELQLPVSTSAVQSVTVDGKPVKWELLPDFGRSLVKISLPGASSAGISMVCQDALKTYPAVAVSGDTGDPVTLSAENGRIVEFHDPQGALANPVLRNGTITGMLTANAGDHLVFGLAQVGETRQRREFKLHVTDGKADRERAAKTEVPVPDRVRWEAIPLQGALNGDIRTIYQQQYLSPRPDTCSLRLATDGYSTWQMSCANPRKPPPEIRLDNLSAVSDGKGHVLAGKGVPFQWPPGANNIAFTSTWDNWPKMIEVPVHKSGEALWFLLCGTTNPMEVRIANAELRMRYADGVEEKLDIVPPFNFWTLCPFGGIDYDYQRDGFALPKVPPTTVQLGKNCRAVALGWRLRPGVELERVTLRTLSDEVIIGLMGATVMNPR